MRETVLPCLTLSFPQTISISVQTTGFSTCSVLIEFSWLMDRTRKCSIFLHCKASEEELFCGTRFHGISVRTTSSHWFHIISQSSRYLFLSKIKRTSATSLGFEPRCRILQQAAAFEQVCVQNVHRLFMNLSVNLCWISKSSLVFTDRLMTFEDLPDSLLTLQDAFWYILRIQCSRKWQCLLIFITWCSLSAEWLLGYYCTCQYCVISSRSSFQDLCLSVVLTTGCNSCIHRGHPFSRAVPCLAHPGFSSGLAPRTVEGIKSRILLAYAIMLPSCLWCQRWKHS